MKCTLWQQWLEADVLAVCQRTGAHGLNLIECVDHAKVLTHQCFEHLSSCNKSTFNAKLGGRRGGFKGACNGLDYQRSPKMYSAPLDGEDVDGS